MDTFSLPRCDFSGFTWILLILYEKIDFFGIFSNQKKKFTKEFSRGNNLASKNMQNSISSPNFFFLLIVSTSIHWQRRCDSKQCQ